MRTVEYTGRFKRDYRREKSGHHGKKLDNLLMKVVDMLAADEPFRADTPIIHCRANGAIIAIVTPGRTSY
jgi:hypothetical protein